MYFLKPSLVSFLLLLVWSYKVAAQITSPSADYAQPTQYTNGMPNDEIFVFCSPNANGNAVTGSLTATPTLSGPGFTFDWGVYDENSHTYTPFFSENGGTSSIHNLTSGGYSVTITNNAGQSETFITWVYVSIVDVNISLALDQTNPGCEPFDVNGTINASGFTYWDPVDPGVAPFIIDQNTTITVCFNANHTYVSDLGFVLVGPPGCGSPAVTLSPNPYVINNSNGCCCNSGNNLNNLCFSTANTNQLNMCSSGTPLSGTYGFYNGNYPGTGGANYPQGGVTGLYGCNAAEGGWAVQIYDCIGADVGSLTGASITFSNGTSTILYNSGAISSTINDNSCDPNSASIYVVPLTTPIEPDPQQVPNQGTLTYQLGLNGNPVSLNPGTNSFTEHVDPIPTYDEWYYLSIQDQLGCAASDSVMFDFTPYADATINDINLNNQVCIGGGPVQLTSVNPGGTWSGTATSQTGLFDPAVAGIGTHTVTYTIPDPCGDIKTIDLTVQNLLLSTASTASICTADNGTASVSPTSGVPPYSYQWNTVPAQTTSTAIGLPAGDHDVVVEDGDGCMNTATVTVPFNPSNLTISIPTSTDALCNSSCDGTASAQEQGGTAPYLYIWDDPSSQQTSQATGLCAGSYNVEIVDVNGCLATASVVINEPTPVIASASMDSQSNCGNPDGVATVSASGGSVTNSYNYSWNSSPAQTTTTATGLVPATYTATVTDDNGCMTTADVTITATAGFVANIANYTDALCFSGCDGEATVSASSGHIPPLTYSWSTTPSQNVATASGLCSGTYEVIVTDAVGCVSTTSVTIGQPVKITATITESGSPLCIGQSANLTSFLVGGTPPYSNYFWTSSPSDQTLAASSQNPTVSPAVTTTYTFVGTDANGCATDPESLTVEVLEPLSLSVIRPIPGPDTSICPYDSALINLLAVGGDGNYSYFLEPGNTPLTLPMDVQPAGTTTYNFTVSDGCTTPPDTASSTVTVHLLPVVDFTGDELNGCHEHSTVFTDQTSPEPVSWQWNFGDEGSSSNSSSIQSPIHKFSGPGTYTVSLAVESAEGCINDSSKQEYIEVYALPSASFDLNPEVTNVLNGTIVFSDLSLGDLAQWNWNFGTGDLSTEQNPIFTYRDTGTFTIWLQVITVNGCTDNTSREVIIEPDFTFYVPNTFTPNSDRKNDSFRGYGEGVDWSTYEMSIFNRWGEEIFHTNSIQKPWDGLFKGKDAPDEVYVWVVKIVDLKGNEHVLRGHVTLMR